jgi:hypothetical protein
MMAKKFVLSTKTVISVTRINLNVGAVIVGSVDGNRLWGSEMKETSLKYIAWSDTGRYLLFGTTDSRVLIYDSVGSYTVRPDLLFIFRVT